MENNTSNSTIKKPRVWFIGAGPGDPELITVKGRRLISEADMVLYAGSLVPREAIACASPRAVVADSAPMTLAQTHAYMMQTLDAGGMVARVHTGDPSLYGAIREQMALLDAQHIPYDIVPGVTSAFAAAAAAHISFTLPEITQSLIITRMEGRTPVPQAEALRHMAQRGTSMAIYLSAGHVERMEQELRAAGLPGHTRIIAAHRVGWPQQHLMECTLDTLTATMQQKNPGGQTVFLVLPGNALHGGPQQDNELEAYPPRSKLYDPTFSHAQRKAEDT